MSKRMSEDLWAGNEWTEASRKLAQKRIGKMLEAMVRAARFYDLIVIAGSNIFQSYVVWGSPGEGCVQMH